MSASLTQALFEQGYAERGAAAQRRYPNESFLAFLAGEYFAIPRPERAAVKVLELGCGSGANLWAVAREGFSAYGIDYAPSGVRVCQEVLRDWGVTAELTLGDICELPYPDDAFDVVFDVMTTIHVDFSNHLRVWAEVFRCLKPGGRFFSYHWGEGSVSLRCGAPLLDHCTVSNISPGYPYAGNGTSCFLSANEVRRGLVEAGFRDVNVEKTTRTYQNQTQLIEYLVITARKPEGRGPDRGGR
jgi:SAM-dependent methyltransferase